MPQRLAIPLPSHLFSRPLNVLVLTATLFTATLATSQIAQAGPKTQSKSYTVKAPGGVKLSVQESGNPQGAPLIFIHGLLGSHLTWDAQLKSPLLRKYRLITYDLRGHGLSSKPTDKAAYSNGKRWADDLATVIESSHARKPVLIGWSLGGTVISNYLAIYGDQKIAGAVYVDGVIELKPELLVAHPQVYRDLNSPDLVTHLDAVRTFLRLCFHKKPNSATFERLLANAAIASWDMQRAVQSMTIDTKELSRTRVPILLIYGERDALVQARPSVARAKKLNPRIKNKLYAESGHAPFLEYPERFNRDLAAFAVSVLPR